MRCCLPLIFHPENGYTMRAATLEAILEALGVLMSFSRPRVSKDSPCSESLFRMVKCRPGYPRRPFRSKEEACVLVKVLVNFYIHDIRHSGFRFVTPDQRHIGLAVEIYHLLASVYEQDRRGIPAAGHVRLSTSGKQPRTARMCHGRLIGGKVVIFPGSYRYRHIMTSL